VLCFILLKISNKFEHDSIHRRVPTYLNYGFMALYGVARLALLILPFTTLRDLPPLMLVDVDWSSVFRHN
jgi:hypothetical protein